jgi:hypothetical protein
MKKVVIGFDPISGKKIIVDSEEETDEETPPVKPKPLLSKGKNKKIYNTDDEKIDDNLNLSEEE